MAYLLLWILFGVFTYIMFSDQYMRERPLWLIAVILVWPAEVYYQIQRDLYRFPRDVTRAVVGLLSEVIGR